LAVSVQPTRRDELCVLNGTDSFKASRTAFNRSLGKALETLSLWRQETPVDANFALCVPHAMRKGVMKCGRREISLSPLVEFVQLSTLAYLQPAEPRKSAEAISSPVETALQHFVVRCSCAWIPGQGCPTQRPGSAQSFSGARPINRCALMECEQMGDPCEVECCKVTVTCWTAFGETDPPLQAQTLAPTTPS